MPPAADGSPPQRLGGVAPSSPLTLRLPPHEAEMRPTTSSTSTESQSSKQQEPSRWRRTAAAAAAAGSRPPPPCRHRPAPCCIFFTICSSSSSPLEPLVVGGVLQQHPRPVPLCLPRAKDPPVYLQPARWTETAARPAEALEEGGSSNPDDDDDSSQSGEA